MEQSALTVYGQPENAPSLCLIARFTVLVIPPAPTMR
jgi:hypothetical protein